MDNPLNKLTNPSLTHTKKTTETYERNMTRVERKRSDRHVMRKKLLFINTLMIFFVVFVISVIAFVIIF